MLGRPELTISSLEINNANPDLINQINAILQLCNRKKNEIF